MLLDSYIYDQFLLVNEELFATKAFEKMKMSTDEDEHSIEMHLPYIAKVMERWGTKQKCKELI